jgi:hypothetical protein
VPIEPENLHETIPDDLRIERLKHGHTLTRALHWCKRSAASFNA